MKLIQPIIVAIIIIIGIASCKCKTDGNYCFRKVTDRDTTIVNVTLACDSVHGIMNWEPFLSHGARGTLIGKKNEDGEFELIYDYLIEGSHQTETKNMKIENNKLYIKKGPLVDPDFDGNLVYENVATAVYSEVMDSVACQ